MPGAPNDDSTVSYTVKELLTDIKGSVDQLNGKLDTKADRAPFNELVHTVTEHAQHLAELRQRADASDEWHRKADKDGDRRIEWWKWLVPTVGGLLVLAVSLLQLWKMMNS